MIRFSPNWLTPLNRPLDDTPAVEGNAFAKTLLAEDLATASMPYSDTVSIDVGSPAQDVSSVHVNGLVLPSNRISKSGQTITLDMAGFGQSGMLVIHLRRATALKFKLLHGLLPPGLTLNANGQIAGVLGNIPTVRTTTYNFVVRVSNGSRSRDRSLTIRCAPVGQAKNWLTSSLPALETDPEINIDYHRLATLKRAEPLVITFGVFDPDELGAELEFLFTDQSGDFIEGPPPGLRIEGSTLLGMVSPKAPPGRYLFRIGFKGQSLNSRFFEIIVENALAENIEVPSVVRWQTPAGLLGLIDESYPSAFSVFAVHELGEVNYALAPGSLPMPPGLQLNRFTGAIEGYAAHVSEDTTFTFTIRANRGGNYADQKFSIRVNNRFSSETVLDVRLKLRSVERLPMIKRYGEVLADSILFRPADPNYGIPEEPYIYLVKGLAGSSLHAALQGDGSVGIDGFDYHGEMNLLLGAHKFAVVRDATGAIIYEVIYREIIDPIAGAGGFAFQTDLAIERKVIYARTQPPKYIYPKSLRNARLDMVRDVGFATNDTTKRFLTGTKGVEALPAWMTTPQTAGDPSTIMGFTPGLVVAHTRPGHAKTMTALLNIDSQLPPNGRNLTFDRYYLFSVIYEEETTFEEGTLFDGGTFTINEMRLDGEGRSNTTPAS